MIIILIGLTLFKIFTNSLVLYYSEDGAVEIAFHIAEVGMSLLTILLLIVISMYNNQKIVYLLNMTLFLTLYINILLLLVIDVTSSFYIIYGFLVTVYTVIHFSNYKGEINKPILK